MSVAVAPQSLPSQAVPALSAKPLVVPAPGSRWGGGPVALPAMWWNAAGVAAFVLINLVLFHLSLLLPAYAQHEERLRAAFVLPYVALCLAVYATCAWIWWPQVWSALKRFECTARVCGFLALSISFAFVLYSAVMEREVLVSLGLTESFALLSCLLLLQEYIECRLRSSLDRGAAVSIVPQLSASQSGMARLVAPTGAAATAENGASEVWVEIPKLREGDQVRIKSGEVVPADGVVVSGLAELYERRLGALGAVRFKQSGEEIYAGSELRSGEVVIRLTGPAEEALIGRLESSWSKSVADADIEKYLAKLEHYLGVGLLLLGVFAAQYWATVGVGFERWSEVLAGVLLVVSIPLGLRLKPLAYRALSAAAYRRGLLLRDVKTIDALGSVHTLAIDYSAQQELGEPQITKLELLDTRVSEDGICSALTVLLSRVHEQVFESLTEFCRSRVSASPLPLVVSDFHYYPGMGVAGTVQNAEFTVGSEDFLIQRGVQLLTSELSPTRPGYYMLYVAIADEAVARFEIALGLKATGSATLAQVRGYGCRAVLYSTEPAELVDRSGRDLGFELASVFAGLEPLRFVERLRDMRQSLFVAQPHTPEERIKAAALSASRFDEFRWNVGESDVLFFKDDLALLAWLPARARALGQVVTSNALVSVGVAALAVALALTGYLSPSLVLMTAISTQAFVYLNTLRLSH